MVSIIIRNEMNTIDTPAHSCILNPAYFYGYTEDSMEILEVSVQHIS